jgi:nitrate/nitrite transporter NarK
MNQTKVTPHKSIVMMVLVLAGEAIFFLPFVLPRVFRPTLLEVFQITNLELGALFSVYGLVAMAAYFFGGPLADRYVPRNLLALALVITGLGGGVLMSNPSFTGLLWLYGFWGLSTILLFWAALLKATRLWGTIQTQGAAFGWLEGGRGAVAALIATVSVTIFAMVTPENAADLTNAERLNAWSQVVLFISVVTVAIGILVWWVLPNKSNAEANIEKKTGDHLSLNMLRPLLRKKTIWLQSIIIVCAYAGYKITDDFSLYAREVLGYEEARAAMVGALALWLRPIIAVSVGIMADKVGIARSIMACFVLMIFGGLLIGTGILPQVNFWTFALVIIVTGTGVFALRGLYFALLEEGKVPMAYTGTVIGIVSVLGFTPDVFMGPLMGYFLDTYPGGLGHQYVFLSMTALAVVGLLAAALFNRLEN